ncbi:MAG: type II toxin-antitoxin system VapC family toxin [Nitrospinota bacterium]|jgi:predicted nucleic acid-binding protein
MKVPWGYFDTSTYIKLYIKENGSEEARESARKNRILSSAILPIECFSALSLKRDMGDIVNGEIVKLATIIREGLSYVELVRVTDEVLKKAEEISLLASARALDAIHIASALIFNEATGIESTFITSDSKQLKVANHFGMKTLFIG